MTQNVGSICFIAPETTRDDSESAVENLNYDKTDDLVNLAYAAFMDNETVTRHGANNRMIKLRDNHI